MKVLRGIFWESNVLLLPVQIQCSYGDPDGLEFALDGRMYELEYQVVDGDMDPPEYALAGSDFTTQGNTAMICFELSSTCIKFIYRELRWLNMGCKTREHIKKCISYKRHVLKLGTPEQPGTPWNNTTPEHCRTAEKPRNTEFDGVLLFSHYRPCKK